jgi:hypothetical protein
MRKIVITSNILAFVLVSCVEGNLFVGEGVLISKEVSIAHFDGIKSFGNNNVTITRGQVQKVQVTGYSNIIDRLKTDVNNGIWKIELKEGRYKNADLSIDIVLPVLNEVELHGSGEILVYDNTSSEHMNVGIYGSGKIELNKNSGCKNLDIDIEGSGSVVAYDEFEDLVNMKIKTIGSGGFAGFPVLAENCDITIEGSGVCSISVSEILNVNLEGSGVVNYKGNPTISTNISGSGKVTNNN